MDKLEINLRFRPSQDLVNKIVMSLFDYLLFSRSQIPFHFELFKKFINKSTKVRDEKKSEWKLEKQLKLAAETLEKICTLKQVSTVEIGKYLNY